MAIHTDKQVRPKLADISAWGFFMHTPMQGKYAIAWSIGGARVGEKNFPLFDCKKRDYTHKEERFPFSSPDKAI